ncbi:LysR substrate-binding domain-containing protein [Shewanella intestini]|uniref:LysR family transcriptional regulator n=1 Tax=Shewanella intestini TaxID=2017544 RepID=A0ABS5I3F4_9GAMM|nr:MULTISPECIES: LysR family transcriptional regulator [Shewanella]MBR9728546.1 LysR family transcriptional regulator [Shewanella intestini]MRG36365.1 LysR family transcriptional regulator [Shewanella sp. XMDDZSB0408]
MLREHKKFERLFLFAEVARQLSFTEAANTLGISRGYLSEQIKQLEQELGRPLLIRSTRSVKLTAQGQLVLARMGSIKSSLIDLDRQIRHDHASLSGQIRITAPSLFTQRFLLPICREFNQAYPEVTLSIDCSYKTHDLTQNDYDLALRATNNPPQNMVAKKLYQYRHICCASPHYLKQFGIPTSIEQLQQHQCLTAIEHETWWLNKQPLNIKPQISINDNRMLKTLALQHHGIILVPEYLVDEDIAQGKLVTVLPDVITERFNTYLIHPQLIDQSTRLTTFIQFTKQWIAQHAV